MKKPVTYPEINREFTLKLNGSTPDNQPLSMVASYGFDPAGWQHQGETVVGCRTGRFKLVQIGHCADWETVLKRLADHGEIPKGQWLQAFRTDYPNHNSAKGIGVADPAWISPLDYPHFPCVRWDGRLFFLWTLHAFPATWLWLVAVKRPDSKLKALDAFGALAA